MLEKEILELIQKNLPSMAADQLMSRLKAHDQLQDALKASTDTLAASNKNIASLQAQLARHAAIDQRESAVAVREKAMADKESVLAVANAEMHRKFAEQRQQDTFALVSLLFRNIEFRETTYKNFGHMDNYNGGGVTQKIVTSESGHVERKAE